jgi:hypothetical protein
LLLLLLLLMMMMMKMKGSAGRRTDGIVLWVMKRATSTVMIDRRLVAAAGERRPRMVL